MCFYGFLLGFCGLWRDNTVFRHWKLFRFARLGFLLYLVGGILKSLLFVHSLCLDWGVFLFTLCFRCNVYDFVLGGSFTDLGFGG